MSNQNLNVDKLIQTLANAIKAKEIHQPLMIGIHTGGVWIANALHQALALDEPLGTIDISFYRDDFTQIGLNPEVKASDLPVDIDGRNLILVDDVLHSGRTTRAAMNVLFDYGRPASLSLAVLLERTGIELPIKANFVGQSLALSDQQHVKISGPEPLTINILENTI